jgi:DNA repair protein RadC
MTIANWPLAERPREKLLLHGVKTLSDAELLAIFFRTGIQGKTALDMARELLKEHGGLQKIVNADPNLLLQKKGFGKTKYAMLKAAIELGCRYLEEDLPSGEPLTSSHLTRRFLANRLKHYPHEVFACLFLDNLNRIICYEELFHGTINESNVYPRELVKRGLKHNAAKVILAHNHPSGSPTPSEADREITRLLQNALELVDIQVIDHVIVGNNQTLSFVEAGLL